MVTTKLRVRVSTLNTDLKSVRQTENLHMTDFQLWSVGNSYDVSVLKKCPQGKKRE